MRCERQIEFDDHIARTPPIVPSCNFHGPRCLVVDAQSRLRFWACVSPMPDDAPMVIDGCGLDPTTFAEDNITDATILSGLQSEFRR